jgi:hypothetical protein
MTAQWRVIVCCAEVALVFASLPNRGSAEEDKAPPTAEAALKILEEAAKPGPEHKKLQPLAGEWTYASKFWMDPSQPPMESAGTIERRWILGDRFLEERVTGKAPDGKSDFEGRGIIGYDKTQEKYTYNWMCTMGTATNTSLGSSDASGKHFTFETDAYCPIRERKVQGRDEIRIENNDKHVFEAYQYIDGKEVKVMELTAVRKR